MAKFECRIPEGYDFDQVLKYFHDCLSGGSSDSFEGGSDYQNGDTRVALRVYESFTVMGGNRMSMTVMLASSGREMFACAVTAAGGGGMAKVVGWGEDRYLKRFAEAARQFEGMEVLNQE